MVSREERKEGTAQRRESFEFGVIPWHGWKEVKSCNRNSVSHFTHPPPKHTHTHIAANASLTLSPTRLSACVLCPSCLSKTNILKFDAYVVLRN